MARRAVRSGWRTKRKTEARCARRPSLTVKTDPRYIMNAFEEGADGVYVIACPIGNCHHVRGNERARARVEKTRKLLEQTGIGGERLDIFFLSGGMGESFAVAAREMTERIQKLGPNPIKAADAAVPSSPAAGQAGESRR